MTSWTVARQPPLSLEFSRKEYWSGSPCHSPGDLPDPGTEPRSAALQADSLSSEPPGTILQLKKRERNLNLHSHDSKISLPGAYLPKFCCIYRVSEPLGSLQPGPFSLPTTPSSRLGGKFTVFSLARLQGERGTSSR